MRAILVFHNCEGQSQKTVSTDHNFWRERRAKADSNWGPSAYQPNALPPGQTGSHFFFFLNRNRAGSYTRETTLFKEKGYTRETTLFKDKESKQQLYTLASCYLCTSDPTTECTELLPVHKWPDHCEHWAVTCTQVTWSLQALSCYLYTSDLITASRAVYLYTSDLITVSTELLPVHKWPDHCEHRAVTCTQVTWSLQALISWPITASTELLLAYKWPVPTVLQTIWPPSDKRRPNRLVTGIHVDNPSKYWLSQLNKEEDSAAICWSQTAQGSVCTSQSGQPCVSLHQSVRSAMCQSAPVSQVSHVSVCTTHSGQPCVSLHHSVRSAMCQSAPLSQVSHVSVCTSQVSQGQSAPLSGQPGSVCQSVGQQLTLRFQGDWWCLQR